MARDTGTHSALAVRRGRPPMAPVVSQLPATTVPAPVHDAAVHLAAQRGQPVAEVVREAVISHLKSHGVLKVVQTEP